VSLGEEDDLVDVQTLVVRQLDHLDPVALDDLPLASAEISQEPDGDRLVAGEVGPDVAREESINL